MNNPELPEIPRISPTVGRRWLAQEIRRLRQEGGFKQSDVAKRLRCGTAKVAHMEGMRNAISGPDLEVLLPFFGVSEDRVDWYLQLADLGQEKGWWDGNQAIPEWFSLYVGLEWGASEIREWDLGFVPGLLQTRAYAETIIRGEQRDSESYLRQMAEARLYRQEALARDEHPPKLYLIIDEGALRRQVGGPSMMREQLEYLLECGTSAGIVLQVMPFSAGPNRGHLSSFSCLDFPRDDDPGVVYVETQKGGLYLEQPEEIASFREVFDELRCRALSPEQSTDFLAQLAKELA